MKVIIGNLFDSRCSTIVNTVNCVGVMGKGIALEFKKRYSAMFEDYARKCNLGELKPGIPYLFPLEDGKSVLLFPTKDHWRSPSRLSYVIDGLKWFVDNYEALGIRSIAFPPLGCGNGGLSWGVVGPIMYQTLKPLPIEIEIYAPFGVSSYELTEEFLSQPCTTENITGLTSAKVNPKWNLILQVIQELNDQQYALMVGRTIYQKICYVLTRNGVETGFQFRKGTYGPYSPQVKDSITALANANLIIEKQLGRMIAIIVSDSVCINRYDYTEEEWRAAEQTADLFGRVKSTEQAEIVSTVLYAYDQLKLDQELISDKDVYDYVLEWKPYWKEEKNFELCDAIQNLAFLSLMDITYSGQLQDTFVL